MKTPNSTFIQQLEAHLKNHAGTDESCFQATVGDCGFRVDFHRIDSLGCEVTTVTCALHTPSQRSSEQLVDLSEKLASKLNYLVEPIQLIEVDREDKAVQLRSSPPEQTENARCYFELNLSKNGIQLCRFEKRPGAARKKVTSVLTQAVVSRLAGDLLAVVEEME